LTPNIHPWGITAGPDGNVWFTEHTTPLDSVQKAIIGRITPSGVITEFTTGLPPDAGPFGITQGPDGNLWFADTGNKPGYGSITTSGKIRTYTNGLSTTSYLYDIAPGPHGTLWFTELFLNKVGKIVF